MAKTKGLSLRGGQRPTWRPEREARGSALGVQSREGSCDFAGICLLSNRTLRDCHVASLLAMTIRGPVPFYRQPVPTVSSAPGGACPSPTTRDWILRVTLHYPLSIFHLHHAAPTTTALIRIGGGGHFSVYLPYRRSYIVFMRRRRWANSAVSRPGWSRQLQLRSLSVPGVFMRASAPRPR